MKYSHIILILNSNVGFLKALPYIVPLHRGMYRKIMIISPGLILAQKRLFYWVDFWEGLFSEGLIIRGEIALQNGLGLTIKTASSIH